MNTKKYLSIVICLSLFFTMLHGCCAVPGPEAIPKDIQKILAVPCKATFYSLEPNEQPGLGQKNFHGFKILGQMEVDPDQEQIISGLLQKAVKDWDGAVLHCFEPRHGLSIKLGIHSYDFLLCYQCRLLYIYKDDMQIALIKVGGSPASLNDILSSSHISLPNQQ